MHSCFILRELSNPELVLSDHIIIHFLEIKKFLKTDEFSNGLEKWMAYFKYEGKDESIMEIIIKDDPLLQKAHQNYIQFTRNDELVEIYKGRMKWQMDIKSGIMEAEEKGALLEKQNVLIRQLSRKFDLSDVEADRIQGIEDTEKLDAV